MKAAIIIPAFNEAPRLGAVLQALRSQVPAWDLIVVNDGSTDDTSAVARACPAVRVLDLPRNRGKGAAMWAGALLAEAELLAFIDADLRGLEPHHVEALLRPVAEGAAEMTVGLFRGGRSCTDFSHVITPWVSGQRGILRRDFLSLEGIAESQQGVEAVLTRAARAQGWRVRYVPWPGVTHAMKEEKLGVLRGLGARLKMYGEIVGGLVLNPSRRGDAPAGADERQVE